MLVRVCPPGRSYRDDPLKTAHPEALEPVMATLGLAPYLAMLEIDHDAFSHERNPHQRRLRAR